jgi:hypothetical protein
MHARITRLQFRTERFYEAIRAVEQEILPHLRREHGFRHIYVIGDRQSGDATVITFWATEEDERDSRARVAHRFSRVANALVSPPAPSEALPVIFEAGPEGTRP